MQFWSTIQALTGYQAPAPTFANSPARVQPDGLPVRVLTHNIRYAASKRAQNEKPWNERFPLILNQLSYHTRYLDGSTDATAGASFICLQEVLHGQLCDLLFCLNDPDGSQNRDPDLLCSGPGWSYIGVGREDGRRKGEYSPILYPSRLFNLLHFENTRLNPTPARPSKGWDAGSVRILTTGVFECKATGRRVVMFNTHLDNAGSEAREKSVGIILGVIERVTTDWAAEGEKRDGLNYVLAGDFNSFITQEAYKAVVASGTMVDPYDAVPEDARYGDEVAFTGFQPDTDVDRDEIGRIDYVWFGPKGRVRGAGLAGSDESKGGWSVKGYSVLPNVFDDGVFCSDHRDVVADALLH